MAKVVNLALLGLAFCGWVLILAGTGTLQAALAGSNHKTFRNYPLTGAGGLPSSSEQNIELVQAFSELSAADFSDLAERISTPGGGIIAALTTEPYKTYAEDIFSKLVAMLPVITEVVSSKSLATGTTFSYCWWMVSFQFFAIVYGVFATAVKPALKPTLIGLFSILTASTFLYTDCVCNAPLGAYSWSHNPTGTPATVTGTHSTKSKNAVFVLFSGLIIVDIANVLFAMAVALDDAPAPAPAPVAAPEAPKAVEEAPATELAATAV